LLHYAIFENKTEFIKKVLPLYENEVNAKNEPGNTPFHYACLKGNLEIVQLFFNMQKIIKTASQGKSTQVDLLAENKAGFLPVHLAIARSHFFVVHFLLSQESVLEYF
jgi:ankyrin repeat protein